MIKTMKRFGVIVTIFVIVFSTLTPLWGASTTHAQVNTRNPLSNADDIAPDMSDVFYGISDDGKPEINEGNYWIHPDYAKITLKAKSEHTAQLQVTLRAHQTDSDGKPWSIAEDGNTHSSPDGVFSGDDYRGFWSAILDDDSFTSYGQSDPGMYLELYQVGKDEKLIDSDSGSSNMDPKKENGSLAPKITDGEVDYNLPKIKQKLGVATVNNNQFKTVNGYNLLPLFADTHPELFFDKNGGYGISTTVVLKGLKPDTKYYYRIHLEENFGNGVATTKILNTGTDFITSPAGSNDDPSQQELEANVEAGTGSEEANTEKESVIYGQKIGCSFGIVGESDWTGCFIRLYWNTLYTFSAWVLRGAAGLMDTFMAISLSSAMYKNSFLETGWTVVRDVCNIFFIFILLWTAFKMVINDHHFNANKTIVNVVIIGLLINFSLFFSRVIVDMGNISARVFYNQIRITGGDAQADQDAVAGAIATKDVKPKAISSALADGLSFGAINSGGYEKINKDKGLNYGTIFLLITLNIIVNLVAMWVFIKVAFAFLGRVLSLWVGMIMSPFAFTSTIVDGGGHGGGPLDIKKLGWTDWLRNMLEAAFYPALYLFFIFLIILLIQSNFAGAILVDVNTLDSTPFLIMTLFKFMFIIGLLMTSAEFAKKMSGTFGGEVTGLVTKAAGFVGGAAIGLATGGVALAGRATIGRAAAGVSDAKMDALREKATGTGFGAWQARTQLKTIEKAKSASFDVRQTGIANTISAKTGINMNALGNKIPVLNTLSTQSSAGGFAGYQERRAAKIQAKAESIGVHATNKKKIEGDIEKRKEKIEEEEEKLERIKAGLEQAKASNAGTFETITINGVTRPKTKEDWQAEVNEKSAALRQLKKGGTTVYSQTDVGTTNPVTGRVVQQTDVGKKEMGLEQMEKALKNNEKALSRQYIQNRMQESSLHDFHGGKVDNYGQLTEIGHADTTTPLTGRGRLRALGNSFIQSLLDGAGAEVLTGIVGGLGTGTLTGLNNLRNNGQWGLASYIRNNFVDSYTGAHDAGHHIDHAGKDGHGHGSHGAKYKDTYKGPSLNIFSGLFSGSSGGGHGGGHDDHGHDDHGHGGGGHH